MAQVSVLLNVYNDEKFLEQCINSVLNQSFKDLELVIVNDGSTDETLTIINKFKQQDSRVVLFDLSENVGRAKAINTALEHAGGQYIAKLDGDDYFSPEKIERQVEYFPPEEGIYYSRFEILNRLKF